MKFAYSTNGKGIVEFDYTTGIERSVNSFPTADELWTRLKGAAPLPTPAVERVLAPFYPDPERPPRYYQQIAINRAVDAIMRGKNRILITMATGTGTMTHAGAKGAQRTFCTFSPVYFKCRKHGGGMGRDCGHRLCASAGISELPRAQGAVMLNA